MPTEPLGFIGAELVFGCTFATVELVEVDLVGRSNFAAALGRRRPELGGLAGPVLATGGSGFGCFCLAGMLKAAGRRPREHTLSIQNSYNHIIIFRCVSVFVEVLTMTTHSGWEGPAWERPGAMGRGLEAGFLYRGTARACPAPSIMLKHELNHESNHECYKNAKCVKQYYKQNTPPGMR